MGGGIAAAPPDSLRGKVGRRRDPPAPPDSLSDHCSLGSLRPRSGDPRPPRELWEPLEPIPRLSLGICWGCFGISWWLLGSLGGFWDPLIPKRDLRESLPLRFPSSWFLLDPKVLIFIFPGIFPPVDQSSSPRSMWAPPRDPWRSGDPSLKPGSSGICPTSALGSTS